MKTINPDITIHDSMRKAVMAFNKIESGHLLISKDDYFVDKSKQAIKQWPKLYKLIKEK